MNSTDSNKIFVLYKNASIIDKLHIYIRLRRSHFDKIDKFIPKKGDILDFGCGHGFFAFFLSQSSNKRTITGIDVSERKIELAKKSNNTNKIKFIYKENTIKYLEREKQYNSIVILNVLYLLSNKDQIKTIQNAARALKKNGQLILVDHDASIRINTFYTRIREFIMFRIFRLTSGDTLTFNPHKWWMSLLKENFKEVKFLKLDSSGFQKMYICKK